MRRVRFFSIDSGVRKGYIMCPRVSHVYMDEGPNEVKITGMGRMGDNFQRKGEIGMSLNFSCW